MASLSTAPRNRVAPDWSSATEYLALRGAEEAKRIWQEYPLRDYGKDWDTPEM